MTLRLIDLTPKFLDFFQAAKAEPDAERRFALWQRHYGFAAVPPTPAGELFARQLLEAAWPRYAGIVPDLKRLTAELAVRARREAVRVAELFGADVPTVNLVAYVGGFEDNAFTARQGGALNVCVPIEMAPELQLPILAHEFTHAVHFALSGARGE